MVGLPKWFQTHPVWKYNNSDNGILKITHFSINMQPYFFINPVQIASY